MKEKIDYFQDVGELIEKNQSPCDKFLLEVYKISTKPGCWSYAKGVIKNLAYCQIQMQKCLA